MIDTGFDGDIVLPELWLDALGQPDRIVEWRMADGYEVLTPSYHARAELPDIAEDLIVVVSVLGNQATVGRGLTDRFLITLDRGQQVIVEP